MKIIQTKSGKTYDISEEQADKIMAASIDGSLPGVWVSGNYLNFFEIQSITERLEARENYPVLPGTVYTRSNKNGRELMLAGFRRFLKDNPNAKKAESFYKELTSPLFI